MFKIKPINFHLAFLFMLFFILIPKLSHAVGGVALGSTRLIYPLGDKQISLAITNSDKNSRFLIQSWIEDPNGNKTNDFILTPPLFVSKPKSENTLRIMFTGEGLPTDKESLYWLNSKAVPSIEKDDIKDKNVLQIAVLSRIKVFVRPKGLSVQSIDAPNMLTFAKSNNGIVINNPSPFYITLVNIKLDGKKLPGIMVPPMSKENISEGNGNILTFQTVNDFGANTPETKISL